MQAIAVHTTRIAARRTRRDMEFTGSLSGIGFYGWGQAMMMMMAATIQDPALRRNRDVRTFSAPRCGIGTRRAAERKLR